MTLASTRTYAPSVGSITGTTLASGVTASSLTSLGSLTGLTVAGQASATRGYREGVVPVGTVGTATSLDMSLGNIFTVTLTASTTLTFTNVPSSGSGCYVTVVITQGGASTSTPSRWISTNLSRSSFGEFFKV